MGVQSKIHAADSASKGEVLRAKVTNAICRLQEAIERDVPSYKRARRIAAKLEEALNRPSEQPIINGPYPEYSVVAYIYRDYRFAIDSICAQAGGWRGLLSDDTWKDMVPETGRSTSSNRLWGCCHERAG